MTDTVTVPRWALEHTIKRARTSLVPFASTEVIRALRAIERALDTKAEMPDEPGHPQLIQPGSKPSGMLDPAALDLDELKRRQRITDKESERGDAS